MAYATIADVEARLGRPLDDSETIIATARLEDAELILRAQIPDLDTKVTEGIYLQYVIMVEADMVYRLIKNPDGFIQESKADYSYMIARDLAQGRLTVLNDEWQLLGVKAYFDVVQPYLQRPGGVPGTLIPLNENSPGWEWV